MVIRRSRRGPFLACSAYPKCRNAKPLKGDKKAAGDKPAARRPRTSAPRSRPAPTDRTCPDCGAGLVIRNGRRGPFLGCSKYPKCRHTEDVPPDLALNNGSETAPEGD
jgi:DNA topoisomerase-1